MNIRGSYPDLLTVGCFTTAGAISGAALACVVAPFELIKNATQTSVLMASDSTPRGTAVGSVAPKSTHRVNSWNACKRIVHRHGILGLYTGFHLHLVRDVVGSGLYFGVYEATKQAMTAYRGKDKANGPVAVATAGTMCGILSWLAVCLRSPEPKALASSSVHQPAAPCPVSFG